MEHAGQGNVRRKQRGLWGLVIATVAYCFFHLIMQVHLPSDGCQSAINHFSPQGLLCTDILSASPHPLQSDDLIVAIEGQSIETWLTWQGPRPSWPSGTVLTYTLVRRGVERTVSVTLRPLPLWPVMRLGSLYLLFSLSFFLLGCFVFWRRPDDPAARVFLLGSLAVALQRCGEVFSIQPSLILRGWPFWLSVGMDQLSWGVILSSSLHFALVFPVKKRVVARHPRPILGLIYGFFPAVGIGAFALAPTYSQGLFALYRVGHISALIGGLVALGIFLHTFRTLQQPQARAQLRWLNWAAVVAVLPTLALYSLPAILGTRRLLPDEMVLLLLLLIPLALAFSIVRYHLWDIDVIIRRSLIYGTLTALLTALYVLLVMSLQRLSQALTGQTSSVAWAFSTLVIALLLHPARQRVQQMVDRLFFRHRYEARRVLVAFTRDVSRMQSTAEILALMLQAVVAALDVETVSIMLREGGTYRVVAARNVGREGAALRFRRGESLVVQVEQARRPLFVSAAEVKGRKALIPAKGRARHQMERLDAVLCIPLMAGEHLIGLLALGRKRSRIPYAQDDLELLTTMGRTAALALDNARLHEERVAMLRQQLARVTAAQEEERRRIARELHDGVGPTLASLNIRLSTARRRLERDRHPVATELRELSEHVQESIQELRRLIYALRPAALDELGLIPALKEYVARYREGEGLEVRLFLSSDEGIEPAERFPAGVETALFRIVQEALNNVVLHAQASRVEITLAWDEEWIRLRIEDDGRGFDPQAARARSQIGLWSMEERVRQLGGRFTVRSAPGSGTTLQAVIPRRSPP